MSEGNKATILAVLQLIEQGYTPENYRADWEAAQPTLPMTTPFQPGDSATIRVDPRSVRSGATVYLRERCLGQIHGRPYWRYALTSDGPALGSEFEDSLERVVAEVEPSPLSPSPPLAPGARVRTVGMLMPSEGGLIGTIIEADPCCPGHWRVEVGNRIFGRVPERNLEVVADESATVEPVPHFAEIPELLDALRYWEVWTDISRPKRDRIASILEWVARQGD